MGITCTVSRCGKNVDGVCSDDDILACFTRSREGVRELSKTMNQEIEGDLLETRVEDLIEDYMKRYQVSFEEAKTMMIEDLMAANEEDHT